jgi:hypothetical protein
MARSIHASSIGLLVAVLGVGLAAPAAASSAEDDLQAVKKAVLASSVSQERPPAEDPAQPPAEAKPRPRRDGPLWFRVRIVEKRRKGARFSLNLPIGLARSLGDAWPIPCYRGCRKHDRCGATLGEILRALDSGQNLVEIEDDEATVRVWVE